MQSGCVINAVLGCLPAVLLREACAEDNMLLYLASVLHDGAEMKPHVQDGMKSHALHIGPCCA